MGRRRVKGCSSSDETAEALNALVIDTGKLGAQQIANAPVTKLATYMRHLDDLAAEIYGIIFEWMLVAVAGESHNPAGHSE